MNFKDGVVNLEKADIYCLHEKNRGDRYYMRAIYSCTDKDGGEYKVHFPQIELPIPQNQLPRIKFPAIHANGTCDNLSIFSPDELSLNGSESFEGMTGWADFNVVRRNVAYCIETIKEPCKEMTLEEIEQKLGHKVKIVNKKENKHG